MAQPLESSALETDENAKPLDSSALDILRPVESCALEITMMTVWKSDNDHKHSTVNIVVKTYLSN